MKKISSILVGLSLMLLGAGCYSSPAGTTSPQPVTPQAASPSPNQQTLSIISFSFQPSSAKVNVGATVVWVNHDPVSHTVTADDGSFDSGPIATGASFSHTFTKEGTFSYHCKIHPSMHGTITVQ
jgi:plastocyanin